MEIKRFSPFWPFQKKKTFLREVDRIWSAIPEHYCGFFLVGRSENSRQFALNFHSFNPFNNPNTETITKDDLIKVLGHLYRDRIKTGVHKYAPVYVEFH